VIQPVVVHCQRQIACCARSANRRETASRTALDLARGNLVIKAKVYLHHVYK
jgi:hypothetical protein